MPETRLSVAPVHSAHPVTGRTGLRAALLVWLLLALAGAAAILWLDLPVHRLALRLAHWHSAAAWVTKLGAAPGIVAALLVGLLGGRRAFFTVFGVLVADGLAVNILKHLIGRGRPFFTPDPWFFAGPSWAGNLTSMPSGHTAVAAGMVVLVSHFAPRWRVLAWTVALFVGASRLVLNMHWLSDVIAGALVGSLAAYGALWLLRHLGLSPVRP